jgi:hypothetical protein
MPGQRGAAKKAKRDSMVGLTRPKLSVVEACVIHKMEKKKNFGKDGKLKDVNQQYVLSYLLSQCKDFKEEM